MTQRRLHTTNSPWEPVVGYSRAVRSGNVVAVAGTTAWDPSTGIVGRGDPAAQARHIFSIIRRALESLGSRLEDVIRVRIYLTDIAHADLVGPVHAEFFGHIRPACTMLAGIRLVDPALLLEVEVDAIVAGG